MCRATSSTPSGSREWTGGARPPRRRPNTRARCGPSPAGNDSGVDPDRRRELTRFGAPAAFLAAVTVAVVLIKAGLNHGADTGAGTASLQTTTAATTTHATTTTKLVLTGTDSATTSTATTTPAAQYYVIQS